MRLDHSHYKHPQESYLYYHLFASFSQFDTMKLQSTLIGCVIAFAAQATAQPIDAATNAAQVCHEFNWI